MQCVAIAHLMSMPSIVGIIFHILLCFIEQSSGTPKVLMTWIPPTTLRLAGFNYNTIYKCSKTQSLYYASDMLDIGLIAGGQIFGMAARLSTTLPGI